MPDSTKPYWPSRRTRKWLAFRKSWMKNHPPNHEGYYICYIPGCERWLTPKEMELDHVESRSRAPEKIFDEHNVRPICHEHNTAKGALSLEEFLEKIGQQVSVEEGL